MKTYLKSASIIAIITSLCIQSAYSCVDNIDIDAATCVVGKSTSLSDNFQLINTLTHLQPSKLHFFWTTGVTLSDSIDYKPITDVAVGGETYKGKFFPYIDQLLSGTNGSLFIKFVCDDLTYNSNEKAIKNLTSTYNTRFEVLFIQPIREKLKEKFSREKETVNILLLNATEGNPAIASDTYRLIGMPFGRDLPDDYITQTHFTYCDVDTFIFNVEQGKEILEKLVNALFKTYIKPEYQYFLGHKATSNDVINLSINNSNMFYNYVNTVIIQKLKEALEFYKSKTTLTLNNKFHAFIKKVEENPEKFDILVEKFYDVGKIKDLFLYTGPGFLNQLDVSHIDRYDTTCTGAWQNGNSLERLNFHNEFSKGVSILEKSLNYMEFQSILESYESCLKAFLYAKRFGEEHPFNIKMKTHLTNNFPFRKYFEDFKSLIYLHPDFQENKTALFNRLTGVDLKDASGCYYGCLIQILSENNIHVQALAINEILAE